MAVKQSHPQFVEVSSPVIVLKGTRGAHGERIPIRLKKHFGQNAIGDVCAFKPEVSKALVAKGAAVFVKGPDADKKSAKPTA